MGRLVLVPVLAVVVGCGSGGPRTVAEPSRDAPSSCPSAIPLGHPADHAPQIDLTGVVPSAPQLCESGEAYIRVERTSGARTLGTHRGKGEGRGSRDSARRGLARSQRR